MPLASIVMATYNTPEEYLRSTIRSILNQTFADYEFIIIDDCSTGNDVEIVKSFSDKRIKLICNEENRGLAYSLNRGLAAAAGKYIVRMDSDDIALPDRLERQLGFMEKNRDIDILGARANCFGSKSGPAIMDYGSDEYVKADLFFSDLILHPTVVMRAESLKSNGLRYDDNLRRAQDYDLWARATESCRFYIMPDVVLQYRCHDKQATVIARDKQLAVCRMVYSYYFGKLGIEADENNITLQRALNGAADKKIKAGSLYKWVKKLIYTNKKTGLFDEKIFEELIGTKLIYSVIKLKKKGLISISAADLFRIFTAHNMLMVKKHIARNKNFNETFQKCLEQYTHKME